MAKARPLRSAAVKPREKASKAPDRPDAARKPAAAHVTAPRTRIAAAPVVSPAKAAARPPVSVPEPVAPPPLPSPIASFTF